MANPFCHVELHASDPAGAKTFYSQMFSWRLTDMPMGPMTYTLIDVGDGVGGGMMANPVPGGPSHWLAYVLVDDLDASTAKAASLGGAVLQPKTEVPDMGWFSVIADPSGAAIGLWQPKKK